MNRIFIIILILSATKLSAQKTSIGIVSSLRGGTIVEPINNESSIENLKSHWLTYQFGIAVEYGIPEIGGFNLKGLNKIVYGKNKNAFNYLVRGLNVNDTKITSELKSIISFDQSLLTEYKLNNFYTLDLGITLQLVLSEYQDKIIDEKSNYFREYGKKTYVSFKFAPIIKTNFNPSNNLIISVGASYYLLPDEINNFRISSTTEISKDYYSGKSIDRIEYFLIIMYSPY
jgi:hypothetical protein